VTRDGAALYGLNPDATYPGADGPEPGAGACLAAVEYAAGVRGRTVGKPEAGMFLAGAAAIGVPPDRCVVIGDRLDADIGGAVAAGMGAVLVETGTHRREHVGQVGARPDVIVASLADLA